MDAPWMNSAMQIPGTGADRPEPDFLPASNHVAAVYCYALCSAKSFCAHRPAGVR